MSQPLIEKVPRSQQTRLRITEVFYSLQGESRFTGLPTVFVRLTGCPLRCYYCDTAYAFTGGEYYLLHEVLDRISSYGVRHVTITGGEPLAQCGSLELLTSLCDLGYIVSLETSGALSLQGVDPRVNVVMDLKTPASGEVEKNNYENLAWLRPTDQLKCVIANRQDYEWCVEQIGQYKLTECCEVWLSPVHGELDSVVLAQWILEDRLPVRLQLQLHKLLWGSGRGR
ncbi:MAG: 7-carboxy-7-deazaguanine synthase QueE [Gammaproteobacteria bacterium]|nr:MAG: 7-carboxy-7-deazaguanine synthase QueE [Gammaproteobacteria bacterium]